jgi:hypothetical protein
MRNRKDLTLPETNGNEEVLRAWCLVGLTSEQREILSDRWTEAPYSGVQVGDYHLTVMRMNQVKGHKAGDRRDVYVFTPWHVRQMLATG